MTRTYEQLCGHVVLNRAPSVRTHRIESEEPPRARLDHQGRVACARVLKRRRATNGYVACRADARPSWADRTGTRGGCRGRRRRLRPPVGTGVARVSQRGALVGTVAGAASKRGGGRLVRGAPGQPAEPRHRSSSEQPHHGQRSDGRALQCEGPAVDLRFGETPSPSGTLKQVRTTSRLARRATTALATALLVETTNSAHRSEGHRHHGRRFSPGSSTPCGWPTSRPAQSTPPDPARSSGVHAKTKTRSEPV